MVYSRVIRITKFAKLILGQQRDNGNQSTCVSRNALRRTGYGFYRLSIRARVVKFITGQLQLVVAKHIYPMNSLRLTELNFDVNTSLSFQAVIE